MGRRSRNITKRYRAWTPIALAARQWTRCPASESQERSTAGSDRGVEKTADAGELVPIIAHNARGKPRLVKRLDQVSRMSMPDLIAMEKFLWKCMDTKIPQPAVVDYLNAIHREVEWRAQDPEFQ